ncbi:hypothetical protein NHQ30_006082 [Ciborinia camelliae]|nr:hypothetical protein NHQ30_006082 [Ciborinia camelliae]
MSRDNRATQNFPNSTTCYQFGSAIPSIQSMRAETSSAKRKKMSESEDEDDDEYVDSAVRSNMRSSIRSCRLAYCE